MEFGFICGDLVGYIDKQAALLCAACFIFFGGGLLGRDYRMGLFEETVLIDFWGDVLCEGFLFFFEGFKQLCVSLVLAVGVHFAFVVLTLEM